MKRGKEKEWQRNPQGLETEKIQVWSASGIMMGVRPKSFGEEIVKEGKGFVISGCAVGFFDPEN